MNLITLDNISKRYGARLLLDQTSLLINEGDRIGLLGRNGSGKSTLLRLIAGHETPDDGQVTIWGHVRVRYLAQEPDLDDDHTVLEALFQSDTPQMRLLRDYERVSFRLQAQPHNPDLQSQLIELSDQMTRHDGWAAEANAKAVLTKLGVTQFTAEIGTLSGGQRKRVALARALLDPGHLLILDEPTNHIDADAIDWLEDYLTHMESALLMVTHDRYFLERVVNRIVELDRRQLVSYDGNYQAYLAQRSERQEQLSTAEEKRRRLLARELEWLRRGAQARSTKQKARKQRIAEMQTITYDRNDSRVAMALAGRRLGKKVLEAHNLSKAYDDLVLFKGLDFSLQAGDRIGVVGPNGAGKSTFLDVLAGKTPADSGEIIWGPTVQLSYFDQRSEDLRDEMTLVDYITELAPLIRTADGERVEPPQMLEWFLFPREEQRTLIGSLSGGEKRRLYLLRTLVHQPNVLFLDEPTNDLDVETLTVLEEFLDNFEGALVVVSHDRYFLDRNVDFIVPFDPDAPAGVLGTRYPAPYRAVKPSKPKVEKAPATSVLSSTAVSPSPSKERKLTWKEKQELAKLETRLPELEAKQAELAEAINTAGSDYQKLAELSTAHDATTAELDEVMLRWLELDELS